MHGPFIYKLNTPPFIYSVKADTRQYGLPCGCNFKVPSRLFGPTILDFHQGLGFFGTQLYLLFILIFFAEKLGTKKKIYQGKFKS